MMTPDLAVFLAETSDELDERLRQSGYHDHDAEYERRLWRGAHLLYDLAERAVIALEILAERPS